MRTGSKRQWWQQLGGMSQGMLFLQGHVVHPVEATQAREACRHLAHDAAGMARHQRAVRRLGMRRLRLLVSLLSAERPVP